MIGKAGRRRRICSATAAAVLALAAASGAVSAVASAAPPDGRAYELVSPPDKHGGDAIASSLRTHAAADGSAVVFASLQGFGDVVGTGVATDYLSERSPLADPGSNGWLTHAITPPQTATPLTVRGAGFETMYRQFTANLDRGVLQTWSPVTGDPYVQDVPNLYERTDPLSAGSGTYALLTPCPLCAATATPLPPYSTTPFPAIPKVAGMSADGEHVLFESTGKLMSDATDGTSSGAVNLYVADHGILSLADVLPDGTAATNAIAGQGAQAGSSKGGYTPHVISADGSRILFTVNPSVCTAGSTYFCGDLYLRDRSTDPATTTQINQPGHPAIYWDASTDGSRVLYEVDGQLYMYDANAPAGSRVTQLSVKDPAAGGGPSFATDVFGVSDDGHYVYFAASDQLVAGEPAVTTGVGIFLWHDDAGTPPGGQLRFIGTLANSLSSGRADRVAGQNVILDRRESRVTPDGHVFLFASDNGQGLLSRYGGTDYDQGHCGVGPFECDELYRYDATANTLACTSCRPDGSAATANATTVALAGFGASELSTYQNHPLTDDGQRVFFNTAEALVPEDVNGKVDAYEWDAATGQAHLLSTGTDASDSYFLDASASGDDAFIATRSQLNGWDTDGSLDVYDVRKPGPGHPAGFPDPPPVEPGCGGESCRGPIPPAPAPPSIGSDAFRGTGNVTSTTVTCARGYVRRKVGGRVRCVRKQPRSVTCRRGTVRRRVHGRVRCVRRARRALHRPAAARKGRSA